MRNGEVALDMGDGDRLRILATGIAGGGVAHMTDSHRAGILSSGFWSKTELTRPTSLWQWITPFLFTAIPAAS